MASGRGLLKGPAGGRQVWRIHLEGEQVPDLASCLGVAGVRGIRSAAMETTGRPR